LYGHPDSGSSWERHCDKALKAGGYTPVNNWPSCYFHKRLKLFLTVYVDDFKLSGPVENLASGWDLIRGKGIVLDPPTDLGHYLGCEHERKTVKLPDGKTANAVVYNMEDYLTSCVDRYHDMCKETTGKNVVLKVVPTPFTHEDQKESDAGRPNMPGPCSECPWCKHTFPFTGKPHVFSKTSADPGASAEKEGSAELGATLGGEVSKADYDEAMSSIKAVLATSAAKPKSKGGKKKKGIVNRIEEDRGELQPLAASVLMKILYAARMARFDLLRPTVWLARYLTKWTTECDQKLHRLVSYINCSKHLRQIGYVGNLPKDISLDVYADADFAGDVASQKSTTGVHLCLEGTRTYFPLTGVSKRQGCISCSTPEAEMVSGHHAYKNVMIPAYNLWDALLPGGYTANFHEDNQAMIRIVETGRNPTMRHIGRVHRISVGWLHERLGNPETKDRCRIFYEDSANMRADIYTKGFTDSEKWAHAQSLIGVVDPKIYL
jgi:hypothetical protein